MARTSAPRRAPLPGDAAARLHRTVGIRLSGALGGAGLASLVTPLCVSWLLAGKERLRVDRAKRLRLAPAADKVIKRLGRSLAMMEAGDECGQQARETAFKTLRAVRNRRVDMEGLLALAAGYRTLRRDDRRRHGSPKVHAPEEAMVLDGGSMVATRVVSERLLSRLGRQAENCLASPSTRKGYAAEMRRGQTAFWRIDPVDEPDSPVWVVAISLEGGTVDELEHVGAFTTLPRDRDALLEFLVAHASPGRFLETVLERHALSPDLVAASRAGLVRPLGAAFAGSAWRFEVGAPGVLAAMPCDGPAAFGRFAVMSWMLHGATTQAGTTLSVQARASGGGDVGIDEEDGEMARPEAAGPRTMLELEVRLALRAACRASPALRRACRAAFSAESPLFIQDWFGTVSASARAERRAAERGRDDA